MSGERWVISDENGYVSGHVRWGRGHALDYARSLAIVGAQKVEAIGPGSELVTFDGEAILDELVQKQMKS